MRWGNSEQSISDHLDGGGVPSPAILKNVLRIGDHPGASDRLGADSALNSTEKHLLRVLSTMRRTQTSDSAECFRLVTHWYAYCLATRCESEGRVP
jgi:hypothetical protein